MSLVLLFTFPSQNISKLHEFLLLMLAFNSIKLLSLIDLVYRRKLDWVLAFALSGIFISYRNLVAIDYTVEANCTRKRLYIIKIKNEKYQYQFSCF